jgi:hypothetical protein
MLLVRDKVASTSGKGVPALTRSKGVGVRLGVGVRVMVGVAVGVEVDVLVGARVGVGVGSRVGVGVVNGKGSVQAATVWTIKRAAIRMRGRLNFITGISSIDSR